jgi:hypothetical protein
VLTGAFGVSTGVLLQAASAATAISVNNSVDGRERVLNIVWLLQWQIWHTARNGAAIR